MHIQDIGERLANITRDSVVCNYCDKQHVWMVSFGKHILPFPTASSSRKLKEYTIATNGSAWWILGDEELECRDAEDLPQEYNMLHSREFQADAQIDADRE